MHAYIGRQPIYDRSHRVQAYELLFRTNEESVANVVDGDEATFRVILNALIEVGLDQLVGPHQAFVNVTRNSVLCQYPQFFPRERIILEVLEDVVVDAELVRRLQDYHNQGFTIAMDDFVDRPEFEPIIEMADVIKLDVQAHDRRTLAEYVKRFRGHTLLAEKIENRDQYVFCLELGFELFQGYYLGRPVTLPVPHIPTRQLPVLHAMSRIFALEGHPPDELADAIAQDLSLTARLLRAARAVSSRARPEFECLEDAVRALGESRLRTWLTLLSLAGFEDGSSPAFTEALVRARACEILAPNGDRGMRKRYYLAGMLSCLGDLMGIRQDEALAVVPLSDEMRTAISTHGGVLGETVRDVAAASAGICSPVSSLDETTLKDAVGCACRWAGEVRSGIGC